MARDKQLTLADYVALALNPTLIVGMVCALLFFLLEVLYAGAYADRMRWALVCFLIGIVCVTRISVRTDIARRATFYALLLGTAVYMALLRFSDGSQHLGWLIALVLMGVVWWSAHRLTRDCIHLDADAEIGNEGLLDAAGMGNTSKKAEVVVGEDAAADLPEDAGWWQRYRHARARRGKKRTPGVWVVYFSLAALPLFGFGQMLMREKGEEETAPKEEEIPAWKREEMKRWAQHNNTPYPGLAAPKEEPRRPLFKDARQYVFALLCVYIGCGLGLLVTTTFVGLRRYLRLRGARMPGDMTGSWLTTGAVLILLLLLLAALLPRPVTDYSLNLLDKSKSREHEASDYALLKDSGGKDKGTPRGMPGKAEFGDSDRKGKGDDSNEKAEQARLLSKNRKSYSSDKDGMTEEVGQGKGVKRKEAPEKPLEKSDDSAKAKQDDKDGKEDEAKKQTAKNDKEKSAKEKDALEKAGEGSQEGASSKVSDSKDGKSKDPDAKATPKNKEPKGMPGKEGEKEAVAKENPAKDAAGTNENRGDQPDKKGVAKENPNDKPGKEGQKPGKDGQKKEAVAKENTPKDSRSKDPQKEGLAKGNEPKDVPGTQAKSKEALVKDSGAKDAPKKASSKDNPGKNDPNKPDANKEAVAKNNAAKDDPNKPEPKQEAVAKENTGKGNPIKPEQNKEAVAKNNAGNEPANKAEGNKEAVAKADPGKDVMNKAAADKNAVAKGDPAKEMPGKAPKGNTDPKAPGAKSAEGKEAVVKESVSKEPQAKSVAKEGPAASEANKDPMAKTEKPNPEKAEKKEEAKAEKGKEAAKPATPPPAAKVADPIPWWLWLLLLLALLLLLLVGYLGYRYWRRRQQAGAGLTAAADIPPFAVFTDPFADGRAEQLSPRELVEYSFNALEAWGKDHDLIRADADTPLEFTHRLADATPVIECEITRLGDLYTLAAYAPGQLPAECVGNVEKFWQGLTRVEEEEAAAEEAAPQNV